MGVGSETVPDTAEGKNYAQKRWQGNEGICFINCLEYLGV